MAPLPSPPRWRRVRLLFILHSGEIGGGSRFLRTLCAFLYSQGADVHVIADRDGPLLDWLGRDGVSGIAMPLGSPRRFAQSLPRLARAIRRLRPDVLHLHGQPAGCLGAAAGRLAGARRLVYSAQFPAFHADFDAWRTVRNRILESASTSLASRVVCLSQWDRGEFLRRNFVSPGRLVHIPNCVDSAFFKALPTLSPARLGLPAGGPLIAFVGRLTDQKGVEDLIRASPVIRAAHAGARVIVAGDGPLRAQLEAMAGRIAPETVVFMGGLLDPLPAFQVADVVVVPSRFEPLGIVAAEALALGKPVVASRIGGLTDIVAHEDTGLLISPGQPRELADAVCRMLDQPEAAREMAARGRRAVQARFSEETVLPRYRDLYRQLVKDG